MWKRTSIFVSLCFIGLCFGGPEGIRTLDLFHAMEARSQLRHRPTYPFLQYITDYRPNKLTALFDCWLQ